MNDAPAQGQEQDYGRLLDSHGGVLFFAAPITSIREEARGLFMRQWLESSASRLRPMRIAWDTYAMREAEGSIETVIAREMASPFHTGEPQHPVVGYAVYSLYLHIHYATIVADSDVFYLARHRRKGWTAVHMLRAAERLLAGRGVDEIWQRFLTDVKPGRGQRDLEVLFRYLGYRPVELAMRRKI